MPQITKTSAPVNTPQPPNSWRDVLPIYPAAELFPLMEGVEFDQLVTDIKTNGLREPIALWGGGERSGGQILDGRNRYRACLAAGIRPRFEHLPAVDPLKYVISANIRRRHLTAEQKREIIAKLIRAAPEKSDRQIAETAKASPTTVGTVRAKMEDKGEVSKLDTRTDAKGVKQPAKKPSAKPASLPPPPPPPEVRETIPQLIDGLKVEGRKNMETMSPGTVARLAALLERKLEESKACDDIGADSRSERERLAAENEELRTAKRRLEIENEGLRSEIDELKAELAKRAPAADGLDVPEFLRRAAPAQGRTL